MMETIIFQDSPLAQYLEGEGEADNNESTSITFGLNYNSSFKPLNFAPRGPPVLRSRLRRNPSNFLSLGGSSKGMFTHIHSACSSYIHSRLGWTENTKFLEQFRYIIIASQLLNDIQNSSTFNRSIYPLRANNTGSQVNNDNSRRFSLLGLFLTSASTFMLAWSIHWLRTTGWTIASWRRAGLVSSGFVVIAFVLYVYLRRQKLQNLRMKAIESASSVTTTAQNFVATASAAITLIQEVELISRGYKMGSPLPPVTRLEEQSQMRKCVRLRRSLCRALDSLLFPCYQAYQCLRPLAVEVDLEKYYDIYEISRTDMEETEEYSNAEHSDSADAYSLMALKIGLQRLHIVRKLFLCSLLALDADGGKSDFARWTAAIKMMRHMAEETNAMAISVDSDLWEEQDFPATPTPKLPLTPRKERMRRQMRKLGFLSQGIRGLQAKMHLLREESDKALEEDDEISPIAPDLLAQYDSIGEDLKTLLEEWEQGRAALANNIDRNEHRKSMSFSGKATPLSPTLSLGGLTVVEGSPPNALSALNGLPKPRRSRSSTGTSSSGEEVFEAVALPFQRSLLTREERIANMEEDRLRHAIVKGKAEANTHMLKELEMVIKLRPRGGTTGRISSV